MIETISDTRTLVERLRERIRREGPMPFRDWMNAALYDPEAGYYCRVDQKKWGREGDYRTSPERSSLFAATFARYFARLYEALGRPAKWTVVEVGAGDGHFARGALQTLEKYFPDVFTATTYVVDDVSANARSLVRKRLEQFADRVRFEQLSEVELDPGIVFSNELLDALPVHRVVMQGGELLELFVNVDRNGNFEWQPATPGPAILTQLTDYFLEFDIQLSEGQVAEVNLEIEVWLGRAASSIRAGYLITVDYGLDAEHLYLDVGEQRGTLRGFHRHQFVEDLLARPGEHDLTTSVNWSFVKSAGTRLGFETVEFEQQDKFLIAAGLLDQLQMETRQNESEAERLRITTAAREMILPGGMASHFQVLVQKRSLPHV